MTYSFTQFVETSKRYVNRITVTKNRCLGFPTFFYQENKVGNYQFALLFFDAAKSAIGIRLTNDEKAAGRFRIAKNNQGHGATIPAQSFFKANHIDEQRCAGSYDYTRIPAEELTGYSGEGDMFVIDLATRSKEGAG